MGPEQSPEGAVRLREEGQAEVRPESRGREPQTPHISEQGPWLSEGEHRCLQVLGRQ